MDDALTMDYFIEMCNSISKIEYIKYKNFFQKFD